MKSHNLFTCQRIAKFLILILITQTLINFATLPVFAQSRNKSAQSKARNKGRRGQGANSANNNLPWKLEYSLATNEENPDAQNWVTFSTGNGPVDNAALGNFDPSQLINGVYHIRLSAVDEFGRTASDMKSISVEKNLKIGLFSVSFNDLSVPVAGLPMQINRTYDSRDKRTGDFGIGWTLDIKNVRLEKSQVVGKHWAETLEFQGGGIPRYCLAQLKAHLITITFPDGKLYKFRVKTLPECQVAAITNPAIEFVAEPGTQGTLQSLEEADIRVVGEIPQAAGSGRVELINTIGVNAGLPYNPTRFQFTSIDGTQYIIDQKFGLEKVVDTNGNSLTISRDGILHSSGKSITFIRDTQGRISEITDPMGNPMSYSYDANGDLISFKDQENNTTAFSYNSRHDLLDIKDPRGIMPVKNEYDATGRLIKHTDAFGKVLLYTHNLAARQEIVTDRLGNPTLYEYDNSGNVLKSTDPLGAITQYTYDSNDNILTQTNALGKTTTSTYDAADNLLTQTDPLGNTIRFTYNSRRQVLTSIDPRGAVTRNTYDNKGNLTSVHDALGNITTFTNTPAGLPLTVTDALTGQTRFEYDSFGNNTKITDALGNETISTYDLSGNPLTQTVNRTHNGVVETITTSYQYDKLGRITQTTYPDGTTTSVEYNALGKQSKSIDQMGRATSFFYDDMGQLIRTVFADNSSEEATYDAQGRIITSTDRAGRVTRFSYDAVGRLLTTSYPDNSISTTTYDLLGRVIASKDALNQTTTYEYDPNCGCSGRRTKIIDAFGKATNFTFDQNGNQATVTDANGHTTSFEYDLNNRHTKVRYHDGTQQTIAYDALGRKTSSTDQAGKTTQYEYDKLGRLTKVVDALNEQTRYLYNELGQQITQLDALNRATRYQYDKLGRRTKRVLPLGQTESYSYNSVGNLISRIDFNGKVTTFAYDNVNRLLSETPDPSFGQAPITFTYTATGRRAQMTDASGTTSYSYNSRDWLTSKQTPQGTLTYTYNGVGNIVSVRSSNLNGLSVDYSYDLLNRLKTVTDNRLGTTQTTYGYDEVGNLTSVALANGVQSNYSYNAINRLTNLTVAKTATMIASYAYTLGAAGNRLAVAELGGRAVNYTYDNIYRLTSETISGAVSQNGSVGYAYDAVGNRLSRTSTVAVVPTQPNIAVDANDRLSSDQYDNNGSTTASNGVVYSYDHENRIISAAGNGNNITIVYNGDGDRVEKTVNGVSTKYLVDTANHTGYSQVAEELQGGQVLRQYTHGLDLISQRMLIASNWVNSFYGTDGHGSVRFLTDDAGTVTDRYDYDVYGVLINQAGTTPNNYRYAGEQIDSDLGLYYNRARYLNVGTGRFWSQDEFEGNLEDSKSLHKYLYADNDPVNRFDPSGHFAVKQAATFAIAAIISTISTLFLTQRVLAPTGDPIKDEVSRTQADLDDAQISLLLLFANVLTPLAGLSSISRRPVTLPTGLTRAKYVRTLQVLQKTCFAAGTLVKLRNSEKSIEKIERGDEVLTKNLETGQVEIKKVTATFSHVATEVITICVADEEPLEVTPNHLFYLFRAKDNVNSEDLKYGGWVEAKKIDVGDYIQRPSGLCAQVTSIGPSVPGLQVYNFEVEGNHNYFVGKQGVLVHNGPCDNIRELAANVAGKFGAFKCFPCKDALVKAFKKAGIKGKVIEIDAGGQLLVSNYVPNEAISTNGRHVVVEVEGFIFDNIHHNGIERSLWEQSLLTRFGGFKEGAIKIVKEELF